MGISLVYASAAATLPDNQPIHGEGCHAPLVNESGLLPLHVSPSLGFIFPIKFGSIVQMPR